MTEEQRRAIQARYFYLTNYQSENATDPIDPLLYVDSGGDQLLHIAAARGDIETVTILLENNVDVNAFGEMENTALHYALEAGHLNVADLLKLRGANGELKNRFGVEAGKAG